MAGWIIRISEEVEVHAHALEDLIEVLMILIYKLPRLYPLFFSVYDYGRSVSVRAAYK